MFAGLSPKRRATPWGAFSSSAHIDAVNAYDASTASGLTASRMCRPTVLALLPSCGDFPGRLAARLVPGLGLRRPRCHGHPGDGPISREPAVFVH
jgi:hypothetical protein